MWKQVLVLWASVSACAASGALELNQATEAELDSIKGFGPSTTARILQERSKGDFRDWADFMARVKGIKAASASKLSAAGLTIQDKPYSAAPKKSP